MSDVPKQIKMPLESNSFFTVKCTQANYSTCEMKKPQELDLSFLDSTIFQSFTNIHMQSFGSFLTNSTPKKLFYLGYLVDKYLPPPNPTQKTFHFNPFHHVFHDYSFIHYCYPQPIKHININPTCTNFVTLLKITNNNFYEQTPITFLDFGTQVHNLITTKLVFM